MAFTKGLKEKKARYRKGSSQKKTNLSSHSLENAEGEKWDGLWFPVVRSNFLKTTNPRVQIQEDIELRDKTKSAVRKEKLSVIPARYIKRQRTG